MSLLRLLTTGKSLVGLKKLEQRYQLPGGKALPKFGGKKNPFRATAFPEKLEPPASEESPVAPEINPVEVTATESNPGQGSPQQPVAPASPHPEREQRPTLRQPVDPRRSPFRALFLWGRAKKLKPLNGPSGRPLVQAELSLDGVKVMRNDLSESDFEIIPAEKVRSDAASVEHRPAHRKAREAELECVPELSKQAS